jgi:DNA-binding HxlR family transcriptional regulator
MLPRTYEHQRCSIARTLGVVGDRWTLLLIRDALQGVSRFEVFRTRLGIAHNVLTDRLNRLCAAGILERKPYQKKPDRYEYHLTGRGRDLWPIVMSLLLWGDKHLSPDGPPVLVRHRGCGGQLTSALACSDCHASLGPDNVEVIPAQAATSA